MWYANGKCQCAVLEFIQYVTILPLSSKPLLMMYNSLRQSHMGQYLAGVIADCLRRFGLEKKVKPGIYSTSLCSLWLPSSTQSQWTTPRIVIHQLLISLL